MGKYFGTDGFRGEANVDLTVEHAYKVGRYLGYYYGNQHETQKAKVVIGKDTRRSSYMFEYALVAGLTASGADVYLMHVTSTPSVSYIVRIDEFDCGIMISASHNPYFDNGIKIINEKGFKLESHLEDEIEIYIDQGIPVIPYSKKENIGKTVDYAMGRNRYIGYLITLATRSYKNVKVGLDCANGAASSVAKAVFEALGAQTVVVHDVPNGLNINENCGSTHIQQLVDLVKREKLDIGFAFDGDVDRCIAVDEKGDIIDGDKILYICGCYLLEKEALNERTIVTTVMSNLGLYQALDKVGIQYEKTAVGDKYVYENMMQHKYSLGGEKSGHIIFSKYATTGDGVLTSIKIMEVMLDKKKKASDLARDYIEYPNVMHNIMVKDKNLVVKDQEILCFVEKMNQELGNQGRLLLRASGTEPVIRLLVEAENQLVCKNIVSKMEEMIEKKGYII